MVMRKIALNAGSSKQGKAERAFVASNWVVARYLKTHEQNIKEFGVIEFLCVKIRLEK